MYRGNEDADWVISCKDAGTARETWRVSSDGVATLTGAQTGTSVLTLSADAADDAADSWTWSVADGGALTIANGGTATMTVSEAVTVSGAATLNGAVTLGDADADRITVGGSILYNTESITATASGTLTLDDCGKLIFLNHGSTGIAMTLPAVSGSGGCVYEFIHAQVTSDDHSINTDSGEDTINYVSYIGDGNAGTVDYDADIVSFVDTADSAGDTCVLRSNGTLWYAICNGAANGAFSAATS